MMSILGQALSQVSGFPLLYPLIFSRVTGYKLHSLKSKKTLICIAFIVF